MNLDKEGPAPLPGLQAPEDWTMDLQQEANQYTAVLARRGVTKCRLSIAASVGNEAIARTALAEKARWWIRDYLERQPTSKSMMGQEMTEIDRPHPDWRRAPRDVPSEG